MNRPDRGSPPAQPHGTAPVPAPSWNHDDTLPYGLHGLAANSRPAAGGHTVADTERALRLLRSLDTGGPYPQAPFPPRPRPARRGWELPEPARAGRISSALGVLPGRVVVPLTSVLVLAAIAGACYLLALPALTVVMVSVTFFNLTVSGLEARWRLYRWRTPDAAAQMGWPEAAATLEDRVTFSLIVPARDEAEVIGDTLRRLLKQTHHDFEIVVTLCDGDLSTVAAVQGIIREYPHSRLRLVTESYDRPSKPQQLNNALRYCCGEVVGVIDAEDDVAEGLLAHVEALFADTGAAVVQGGVQLMNLGDAPSKWFQVHNVLEYFFWFTSRMTYQANAGFVPLGGNTVFIRRDLLVAADGWPLSLTEDCALGVLLATRFGAKVATAYSAELVTREECPASIFNKEAGSLFWQRDRWMRGFLAELVAGKWLSMPTLRQKFLAGYILATPFLQAVSFLLLPFAVVVVIAVKAPILVTLLTFTPVLPIGLTVLSQLTGLRAFGKMYRQRTSAWHYLSILVLAPVYQVLLAAAAMVATYKYLIGDTTWYKTGRVSAHRQEQPDADYAMERASA